jgi:hypothetical protein
MDEFAEHGRRCAIQVQTRQGKEWRKTTVVRSLPTTGNSLLYEVVNPCGRDAQDTVRLDSEHVLLLPR